MDTDLPAGTHHDAAIIATGRAVVQREAAALAGLPAQLGDDFAGLVRRILATPGKVITTGTGTSGMMAERLAHLLAVSGTPAFYLPGSDALHGGMGAVSDTDLVIAISKSGQSTELTQLADRLGERGVPVVAVTENPESPFARAAATVITIVTDPAAADLGGLIATGSTLVVGAWGDALAAALMACRRYPWEQVIATHPAGGVGRQTRLPEDPRLLDDHHLEAPVESVSSPSAD